MSDFFLLNHIRSFLNSDICSHLIADSSFLISSQILHFSSHRRYSFLILSQILHFKKQSTTFVIFKFFSVSRWDWTKLWKIIFSYGNNLISSLNFHFKKTLQCTFPFWLILFFELGGYFFFLVSTTVEFYGTLMFNIS